MITTMQGWFLTWLPEAARHRGKTHQVEEQILFQKMVFLGTPFFKHERETSEDFKGNNFGKTHILSQLTFLGLTQCPRKEGIRIASWAQLQMEWKK